MLSKVFCPSFPPFHIFWVAPGHLSARSSHSVDVSLHWRLAKCTVSLVGWKHIGHICQQHPKASFIYKNDCKWMSLWPKWSESHGEGDMEGERDSIKKGTQTQTTRNCWIKLYSFRQFCWSKPCCGWAMCQVRCINAMGASDWSDPSTPVMLRQARYFRVKQVQDQEVAPFQLLTVGPLNIVEPLNTFTVYKCCL